MVSYYEALEAVKQGHRHVYAGDVNMYPLLLRILLSPYDCEEFQEARTVENYEVRGNDTTHN